ncbi:MAG: hypothetical protein ACRDQB_02260 [Thermocrispum sp.]
MTVATTAREAGNPPLDGHSLRIGQWLRLRTLTSPSGRVALVHRHDGELLLRDSRRTVWSVGSAGIAPGGLVLLSDGDLVLYDDSDWPVWSSGTAGLSVDQMLVTDDGAMVLVGTTGRVRWSTLP